MVILNVSLPICNVDETEARPQLLLPRKLTLLSAITAVQVLFVFVCFFIVLMLLVHTRKENTVEALVSDYRAKKLEEGFGVFSLL